MCLGAIYWARIDRIYYGNTRVDAARIGFDDEFLYTEIVGPPERRKIPMARLLEVEVQEALRAWERKPEQDPVLTASRRCGGRESGRGAIDIAEPEADYSHQKKGAKLCRPFVSPLRPTGSMLLFVGVFYR